MKKKILLLFICLFIIAGCSKDKNQADMSAYSDLKEKNQYRTGDYEEITKAMVEFEPGVYVIGHPALDSSLKILPVLNEVLKGEKLEAFYLDMHKEDLFTTNINRRIVEFDQGLDASLQSGNHRPFVVVIGADKIVKTFHAGMSEIIFSQEPISEADSQTLKTTIKSVLFEK